MIRQKILAVALGLGAAAGLGVSLLAAAAPASAAPSTSNYQEAWAYVPGSPGAYVSGVAYCPPGTVVVGGGAGNGRLLDLQPVAGGSAFTAAGQISSTGPNYLSVQAVCAPAGEFASATRYSTRVRVHSTTLPFSRTNTCPVGSTAYAGGLSLTPKSVGSNDLTHHYGVYADFPQADGRGWTVGALGDTANYDLDTSVSCLPDTRLLRTVTVTRTYAAGANNAAAGYAYCPTGTSPFAGGAWWSTPTQAVTTGARLTADYQTHQPGGWWASGPAYVHDATLHVTVKCSGPPLSRFPVGR